MLNLGPVSLLRGKSKGELCSGNSNRGEVQAKVLSDSGSIQGVLAATWDNTAPTGDNFLKLDVSTQRSEEYLKLNLHQGFFGSEISVQHIKAYSSQSDISEIRFPIAKTQISGEQLREFDALAGYAHISVHCSDNNKPEPTASNCLISAFWDSEQQYPAKTIKIVDGKLESVSSQDCPWQNQDN